MEFWDRTVGRGGSGARHGGIFRTGKDIELEVEQYVRGYVC